MGGTGAGAGPGRGVVGGPGVASCYAVLMVGVMRSSRLCNMARRQQMNLICALMRTTLDNIVEADRHTNVSFA